MLYHLYLGLLGLGSVLAAAQSLALSPGDKSIIPEWRLQSSERVSSDMPGLSRPGADVSSWYRVAARGTVMAGLIENGVYNDTDMFFSDNMKNISDASRFQSPWIYRQEFISNPSAGQYLTLHTHGITSKAEIYVNGALVASSEDQKGSFGGRRYNLTDLIQSGTNCILIRAYPTNYLRDFAMGFIDWNPYPADNGTGVWRHVELSRTGAVSMTPFRVATEFNKAGDRAIVTLTTDLVNNALKTTYATVNGSIIGPGRSEGAKFKKVFTMRPLEEKKVSIEISIRKFQIWWPASWGKQPLYTVFGTTVVQDAISDRTSPQRFGFRQVASEVNKHNDTGFTVNGLPFQVLGAGYSPDMFMRFDKARLAMIFRYMLDMGLNTVRLEGKPEHPELYDLADEMGLMVLSGWDCCDKWEGWEVRQTSSISMKRLTIAVQP